MKRNLICLAVLASLLFSSCRSGRNGVYDVTDFGAYADGVTLTTGKIQKAIDRCAKDGGGVVYVPKGDYLVGTINLRSDIEFRMEKGARLIATTDLSQYQKQNDELAGVFYTENARNVSITGHGVIFGQGMEFMYADSAKVISGPVLQYARQREGLREVRDGIGDGPLYPKDRFHQMIVFSNCTGVELQDFKCVDSPYWCFLIVHCDGVCVDNVKIDNNLLIPNSDGLDIISSSNVTVSNCNISCGDDAIVLAGYDWHFGDPGFKRIARPVRNICVTNCVLRSRSSAIRIGGWDQNHMSDFNISNIDIYDSNCGIGICIRDYAGLDNLNFSNFNIHTRLHTGDWWGNGEPIKITAIRDRKSVPGAIRNLHFSNFYCEGENSVIIYASPECTIENIDFVNFDFRLRQGSLDSVAGGNFDFRPSSVPDREMFAASIPILYMENVKNVSLTNGRIFWVGEISHTWFDAPIGMKDIRNPHFFNVQAAPSPVAPQNGLVVGNGAATYKGLSKM